MSEPAGVHRWVIRWRSSAMRASAFDYYRTKRQALNAFATFAPGIHSVSMHPVRRCYCAECKALRHAAATK